MLARAFQRHGGDGSFQDLQQRLLNTLTGHVTGDGGVLTGFAGDLIDFVNVDDAVLGSAYVAIRSLEETLEHGFHIVAYIAGFGQGGGVGDDERHVHYAGQRLRKIGFAHAGGAEQQNV